MKFNMYIQLISPSTGAIVAHGYSTAMPFEVETEALAKDEQESFVGYVNERKMMSLSLFRRDSTLLAHEIVIGSNVLDVAIFDIQLKEIK